MIGILTKMGIVLNVQVTGDVTEETSQQQPNKTAVEEEQNAEFGSHPKQFFATT